MWCVCLCVCARVRRGGGHKSLPPDSLGQLISRLVSEGPGCMCLVTPRRPHLDAGACSSGKGLPEVKVPAMKGYTVGIQGGGDLYPAGEVWPQEDAGRRGFQKAEDPG